MPMHRELTWSDSWMKSETKYDMNISAVAWLLSWAFKSVRVRVRVRAHSLAREDCNFLYLFAECTQQTLDAIKYLHIVYRLRLHVYFQLFIYILYLSHNESPIQWVPFAAVYIFANAFKQSQSLGQNTHCNCGVR